MDFFSRLSRTEAGQEPTDLAQVRADDALIETLRNTPLFEDVSTDRTTGYSATPAGSDARHDDADDTLATSAMLSSSDDQVAQLLQAWRREIDSVPLPAPIDIAVATAVVQAAPPRRRAVRPMLAVTAAIAALLVGSAAIGARSATPNDALWPVTQLLWGDRADSVKAGIDARKGIDEASNALEMGNPEAAETAIDYVTVIITKVEERDGASELRQDLDKVQDDLDNATNGRPTTSTSPVSSTITVPTSPPVTSSAPTTSELPPVATTSAGDPTTTDQGSTQPPTSEPVIPPTDPTGPSDPSDTPTSSTDDTPSSSEPTETTEATTESSTTESTTSGDALPTVNATTEDAQASVVEPTA